MVRVFIFGATGFLGGSMAASLRRNGHTVYGLARDDKKAKALAAQEIIPVVGDISNVKSWLPTVESYVDVVIDSSPSYGGITESIIDAIVGSSRGQVKGHAAKIAYIYVSGVWVHGQTDQRINDLSPVGEGSTIAQPADIVAWRPALEQKLLAKRDVFDVAILRPGLLFGYSGSLTAPWFGAIAQAVQNNATDITIEAIPDRYLSWIHQADIGEVTTKLVEKIETISKINYPVFDVIGDTAAINAVVSAAARVLGHKGTISYKEPSDVLSKGASTAANIDGSRAERYLEWTPRHKNIVGDIDIYVKAFLASQ